MTHVSAAYDTVRPSKTLKDRCVPVYKDVIEMPGTEPPTSRLDLALVIVSAVTLGLAAWVWVEARQIAREVAFFATTIALVIALVLVVNVAVLIIVQLHRRVAQLEVALYDNDRQTETPNDREVVIVTLTPTERRVINRLEENGGQMTQDELRRTTGLSKSTLSVTLGALERKSLITREVSGRTRIVTLVQRVVR